MNFGAMLGGVAGGFNDQEKVNIGKESNRIKDDEIAMQGQQEQMRLLTEGANGILSTIEGTISTALDEGSANPEALARANAPLIAQLQKIDAVTGGNRAQQAMARLQALQGSGPGMGGYEAGPKDVDLGTNTMWKRNPDGSLARDKDNNPIAMGVPGTNKPPQEAIGRVALLDQGLATFDTWAPALFKDLDMGDRWGMAIQGWTGVSVNKAAEASRQARSMVEGALRAMTGAAAPETEVVRYDALFMPKPWDNQATRQMKLNALRTFAQTYSDLAREGYGGDPRRKEENLRLARERYNQIYKQQFGKTVDEALAEEQKRKASYTGPYKDFKYDYDTTTTLSEDKVTWQQNATPAEAQDPNVQQTPQPGKLSAEQLNQKAQAWANGQPNPQEALEQARNKLRAKGVPVQF